MANHVLLDKKRQKRGLTYYYSVRVDEVITGVCGENRHGVNHEATCTAQDFVSGTERGQHCRRIIRDEFGEKAVERALAALAEAGVSAAPGADQEA
jgi:hypothetical protein